MELSIEAKLAAAVAVAFAALSIGAIAQEQGEHGAGGPASGSGRSHMTARGFDSSLSGLSGRRNNNEVLGLQ
jgi:hypothetical protein